ncbi:hypothetical protein K501DRAFT_315840, partial [Backusella circina FSU 941]
TVAASQSLDSALMMFTKDMILLKFSTFIFVPVGERSKITLTALDANSVPSFLQYIYYFFCGFKLGASIY